MRSLLFLCHRIPFPPDKGEKIRAFRILQHLAQRFRVHLGCFIDDPADWAHIDALKPLCAEVKCVGLSPGIARLKALPALLTASPLSVASFANREMAAWVTKVIASEKPAVVFGYSSAVGQFVMNCDLGQARFIMDFVDVDPDKWRQYAETAKPPMRWIFAREARCLLAYDRQVAARADACLFVSDPEAALFRKLAPETASKTFAVPNGIDCEFFSPTHRFGNPFGAQGPIFVFTGTMDYRPNVDAVIWFANEIFPKLTTRHPHATFAIVGAKPTREICALTKDSRIVVTGRVPDVRPYIAHANVVVTPLRIARGIQNKILEGMAMAKPVVTTPHGLEGIEASPGRHLLVAADASTFADAVLQALEPTSADIGRAARQLMEQAYAWPNRLAALDDLCTGSPYAESP